MKVEKELRAERDHCLELEERIQELEAVSATQQSAVRAKQEQVDVLQVSGHQRRIGKRNGVGGGQRNHEGGDMIKEGSLKSGREELNQGRAREFRFGNFKSKRDQRIQFGNR